MAQRRLYTNDPFDRARSRGPMARVQMIYLSKNEIIVSNREAKASKMKGIEGMWCNKEGISRLTDVKCNLNKT